MLVTVLKRFDYSPDGHAVVPITAGPSQEIRDELVTGLVREGFVEDPAITAKSGPGDKKATAAEKKAADDKAAADKAAADQAAADQAAADDKAAADKAAAEAAAAN